ncbi:Protein CBG25366 [Caenorhabditis briggsae]|uniref:Uncharacterized protein n=2 Tax=Caenorhabditis briggsae TaxID=6238 RepID=A0AAE9DXG4_CAEBR|nr:Protein CBG25366 [Caenorhabditis briggsae]ULU12917.1 hypothetical protein L3Y34_015858 [Caenorhabditis briggsae]CAR99760.1 Protein CBG25366 [Caenorhabditis briggsae]
MSDEVMTQHELIKRFFVLEDLHSMNYGVYADGRLSIVDFKVGDSYGNAETYWESGNRQERQRVARQCFESWKLEEMVIKAKDSINEKTLQDERDSS